VVFNGYDGAMLLRGTSELNTLTNSEPITTHYEYDARNNLARAVTQKSSGPIADTSYTYDGLGNLRSIVDNLAATALQIRPDSADPDRICTVAPPSGPTSPCNYQYDARGNVWQIRDIAALFTYDAFGRLGSTEQGGQRAQLDYDPFGTLASLNIRNGNIQRREQLYGGASAQVGFFDGAGNPISVGDPGATFQNYVDRYISSPIGTLALVRRPNSGQPVTLYPIGDYQGTRAVIGSGPIPTQTISYAPFGSITSDSSNPNSLTWWPYQWNGGHVLDGLGLVVLGQRVLEPRTGRFLQRDPLMQVGTASAANPYAFAANNPVKFIDATGAQPTADSGGTVVGGLAAGGPFGALVQDFIRNPPVPGEKIEPVEMQWACDAVHDCTKSVEMLYPHTDFEKQLRQQVVYRIPFIEGARQGIGRPDYYHLILDNISGAVLGYALYEANVVEVYDRQGNWIWTGGKGVEADTKTWFQPADFLAGPIASTAGIGRRVGVRSVEAVVEKEVADEAASGGAAMAMRRPPPFQFSPHVPFGWTDPGTGQIFINSSLVPGTKDFTETLFHEQVHSWFIALRPALGLSVGFRQRLGNWFFETTLGKYWEEALAETWGTTSLLRGLRYPFWAEGINPGTLVLQQGVAVGGIGGAWYGSYKLGQWLFGGAGGGSGLGSDLGSGSESP
jgi:RHS repeat-associated protein